MARTLQSAWQAVPQEALADLGSNLLDDAQRGRSARILGKNNAFGRDEVGLDVLQAISAKAGDLVLRMQRGGQWRWGPRLQCVDRGFRCAGADSRPGDDAPLRATNACVHKAARLSLGVPSPCSPG
jgi:hypothetical protein